MNYMDWKRKLGSRKFWALLSGLATSIMVLFGMKSTEIEKVVALITALGSVVGYMFAEAYVDGKSLQKEEVDREEIMSFAEPLKKRGA